MALGCGLMLEHVVSVLVKRRSATVGQGWESEHESETSALVIYVDRSFLIWKLEDFEEEGGCGASMYDGN
jgi:hypothetical protein